MEQIPPNVFTAQLAPDELQLQKSFEIRPVRRLARGEAGECERGDHGGIDLLVCRDVADHVGFM